MSFLHRHPRPTHLFIGVVCALLLSTLAGCRHRSNDALSAPPVDTVVSPPSAQPSTSHFDSLSAPNPAPPCVTHSPSVQLSSRGQRLQAIGCDDDEWVVGRRKKTPLFNPALLIGQWLCGSLHEVYRSNGTGCAWDTADDVFPNEAQPFNWQMGNDVLIDTYAIDFGGIVPDVSIIVSLDSARMVRRDGFGRSFVFLKVADTLASHSL